MSTPPEYMHPLLHSIETTVLEIKKEFPVLADKDIEFTYEQLKNYFDKRAKGKNINEPLSTIERRQALIDEILNVLEFREEAKGDEQYIMSEDYLPGGRPILNLSSFYAKGINHLRRSLRFWAKKDEQNGYIRFITSSIPT